MNAMIIYDQFTPTEERKHLKQLQALNPKDLYFYQYIQVNNKSDNLY